jgi:alginate O-acetyltransferase complex protein AlgI
LVSRLYAAVKKSEAAGQLCHYLEPVACMMILIASTAYLVDGSYNPFMYFRF